MRAVCTCSKLKLILVDEILLMLTKQAIVDRQREIDQQIAALLTRSVNYDNNHDDINYNYIYNDNYNYNDNDDDDEAFDAVFGQDTTSYCWFSVVDQTPSPSDVDAYNQQTCFHDSTAIQLTPASMPSSTTTSLGPARRRRTRHPHSKAAVGLLRAWYDEHRSKPYASDAEVRRLAAACQLRVRQVQKWLSNQRRIDGNTRRRSRPAHNAKRTAAATSTTTAAVATPP